jgi:hypothetical protein
MSEQIFSLIPFTDPHLPEIRITGSISRKRNDLSVCYELTGNIDGLSVPEPAAQPARTDELWKSTCLEFFIAVPNQPEYWEFNMSPSGNWNIYHMDAYRRIGFREETSIQRLPFSVRKETGCVSINVTVDLSPIVKVEDLLRVGITSIIQTNEGYETYWALRHPEVQADFHLRESFIIEL